MTMNYVVGFVTDDDHRAVLLVRKARPEWQAGLLNGIGGKVQHLPVRPQDTELRWESPLEAMRREFSEETGLSIDLDWTLRFELRPFNRDYKGNVLFWTATMEYPELKKLEGHESNGEKLELWPVSRGGHISRYSHAVPNLSWALPLALDRTVKHAVIMDTWNRNASDEDPNLDELKR